MLDCGTLRRVVVAEEVGLLLLGRDVDVEASILNLDDRRCFAPLSELAALWYLSSSRLVHPPLVELGLELPPAESAGLVSEHPPAGT